MSLTPERNDLLSYDVHAHCLPDGVLDTLRRDGGRYDIEIVDDGDSSRAVIAGRVDAGPLRADFTDLDARRAAMDRAGVDVQLLSTWIDLTAYALPTSAGARYARMFNEALAATAEKEPARFLTLATVPLQDPAAAARELRHAVTQLGMVGVEIATTVDGVDLDDPALEVFWAAAADLRCLVLVHPYASLAGRGLDRYFLGNLVGNPAETTIAAAHLILGGALQRFEDLTVCLVHGGGFLPYQVGRLDRGFQAKAELVAQKISQPPSTFLQRLYFDTVTHSPEALAHLVRLVGAERVVLGSDYPFEMGDADPLATVAAIPGLDEAERELIMRGNVARILARIRS